MGGRSAGPRYGLGKYTMTRGTAVIRAGFMEIVGDEGGSMGAPAQWARQDSGTPEWWGQQSPSSDGMLAVVLRELWPAQTTMELCSPIVSTRKIASQGLSTSLSLAHSCTAGRLMPACSPERLDRRVSVAKTATLPKGWKSRRKSACIPCLSRLRSTSRRAIESVSGSQRISAKREAAADLTDAAGPRKRDGAL